MIVVEWVQRLVCLLSTGRCWLRLAFQSYCIVPNRTHSYRHTALSEISNGIVGKILLRTIEITHCFSSDVGFWNIVVWSTGQSGVEYRVPTVRGNESYWGSVSVTFAVSDRTWSLSLKKGGRRGRLWADTTLSISGHASYEYMYIGWSILQAKLSPKFSVTVRVGRVHICKWTDIDEYDSSNEYDSSYILSQWVKRNLHETVCKQMQIN